MARRGREDSAESRRKEKKKMVDGKRKKVIKEKKIEINKKERICRRNERREEAQGCRTGFKVWKGMRRRCKLRALTEGKELKN